MLTEVKDGYVKSEFHNGVTTIEFFHPQSNSLPARMLDELTTAIHGAGNEPTQKLLYSGQGVKRPFVPAPRLMS
jgi:methylglutaconyl-CoA hydratase